MRLFVVLSVLVCCLSTILAKVDKLQIEVLRHAECQQKSVKGDKLSIHYTGTMEDGKKFDSSVDRNEPFTFILDVGQVIKGWDQGLLNMCAGEKRRLKIPSHLGYGKSGFPPLIPGGANLIFEIELLKIENKKEL